MSSNSVSREHLSEERPNRALTLRLPALFPFCGYHPSISEGTACSSISVYVSRESRRGMFGGIPYQRCRTEQVMLSP
jgi:hypothetical protein